MLAVRSLDASTEKYLRNCIGAYWRALRNLRWIAGVVSSGQDSARVIVETRFSAYAAPREPRVDGAALNDGSRHRIENPRFRNARNPDSGERQYRHALVPGTTLTGRQDAFLQCSEWVASTL